MKTSFTNLQSVDPLNLADAIKYVEEAQKQKDYDEERMLELVSSLVSTVGWKTFGNKYLPNGYVFIGTGENIDFLSKPKKGVNPK